VTVPKEPALSYQNVKVRTNQRKASMDREISKELMARNISLENIKTKEYLKDDEFTLSFHNHFFNDEESETMLDDKYSLEAKIEQSKKLIAQRVLESTLNKSKRAQFEKSNISSRMVSEFSKSSSNIANLKNSLVTDRPHKIMSPPPISRCPKPPLPPQNHQIREIPHIMIKEDMLTSEFPPMEPSNDLQETMFEDFKTVFHEAIQSIEYDNI
jgi:hypothetical protein